MVTVPNRILLIVVAGVVAVGIVAGVLAATRELPTYDRGTPEGAVQAYLSAVVDRDHATAVQHLGRRSSCTVEDLDRSYVPEGLRVVLRDTGTEPGGNTARVRVDVVTSTGGPFDAEYSEPHTFRLSRSAGEWRIQGAPWPMYACGPVR